MSRWCCRGRCVLVRRSDSRFSRAHRPASWIEDLEANNVALVQELNSARTTTGDLRKESNEASSIIGELATKLEVVASIAGAGRLMTIGAEGEGRVEMARCGVAAG